MDLFGIVEVAPREGFLRGKRVAHVWLGDDTACRMRSTGGITRSKRYTVSDTSGGLQVCHMCQVNSKKLGIRRND